MSMTVEDLKDAVCDLVSIAEEYVDRKYFEELDNKGVAIIDALDEFRELKEKATAKKPIPFVPDCASINFIEFVCPNCKGDVPQMLTPRYCDCGQKLDWSEGKE